MNVTCADCRSVFRVDPAKVPTDGVVARCAVCGATIVVDAQGARRATVTATAADTLVEAVATSVGSGNAVGRATRAVVDTTASSPVSDGHTAPPTTPITQDPEGVSESVPLEGAASAPPDVSAASSATDERSAIWESAERVPAAFPGQSREEPVAQVDGTPEPSMVEASTPRPTPPVAAPRIRRAFNPYLASDPDQKARRLARALVSDIVAYHPQKREQGLRDGTLRQLFADEIKKSWQEYVDQVGSTLAESTPHFQDALNDVLAGGRKTF